MPGSERTFCCCVFRDPALYAARQCGAGSETYISGGPDRIRTGDLLRDRETC